MSGGPPEPSGQQTDSLETGDQMRHFVTTPDPTVVNC
jgi:hypothetical protein